jgi:predicted DNA-binding protein (UPF0251 family)
MNPLTVQYRLRLKGYTFSRIARETQVSKQVVWEAINNDRRKGLSAKVWDKILKII